MRLKSKWWSTYGWQNCLVAQELKYHRVGLTDLYNRKWAYETRSSRGRGKTKSDRQRQLPANLRSVLQHNDNKIEVLKFLPDKIAEMHRSNVVIVTKEDGVLSWMKWPPATTGKRTHGYFCMLRMQQKRVAELS